MDKEKKRTLLRLLAVLLILAPTVVILLTVAFGPAATPADIAECAHIRMEAKGEVPLDLKEGEPPYTLVTGLLSLCTERALDAPRGKTYTVTAEGMEAKLSTTESGHLYVKMNGDTYGICLSPLMKGQDALSPAMLKYAYFDGERYYESDAERRESAYYVESVGEITSLRFEDEAPCVKVLIYETGSETPLCTLDSFPALSSQRLDVNKSYQIYVSAELVRQSCRIRYVYEFYLHRAE